MTTRTDYLSLMALDKVYNPDAWGFVSEAEADLIKKELEIEQRTGIELNNIRDMTVLIFGAMGDSARKNKNIDEWTIRDKMSAIVFVIDTEKIRRCCEI